MLRAWRDAGGELHVRITEAATGGEAALEVSTAATQADVIAAVTKWLGGISSPEI